MRTTLFTFGRNRSDASATRARSHVSEFSSGKIPFRLVRGGTCSVSYTFHGYGVQIFSENARDEPVKVTPTKHECRTARYVECSRRTLEPISYYETYGTRSTGRTYTNPNDGTPNETIVVFRLPTRLYVSPHFAPFVTSFSVFFFFPLTPLPILLQPPPPRPSLLCVFVFFEASHRPRVLP